MTKIETYNAEKGKAFVRKSDGKVISDRLIITGGDNIDNYDEREVSEEELEDALKTSNPLRYAMYKQRKHIEENSADKITRLQEMLKRRANAQ